MEEKKKMIHPLQELVWGDDEDVDDSFEFELTKEERDLKRLIQIKAAM